MIFQVFEQAVAESRLKVGRSCTDTLRKVAPGGPVQRTASEKRARSQRSGCIGAQPTRAIVESEGIAILVEHAFACEIAHHAFKRVCVGA